MNERHVLGISGGRDSAALAVYMRQFHPEIEMTYFFTDTGKELPEVYEFLGRLEGVLGKPILRLKSGPRLRFLAQALQQFSAIYSDPLVHPPAEAQAFRSLDQAVSGRRRPRRQLRRDTFRREPP